MSRGQNNPAQLVSLTREQVDPTACETVLTLQRAGHTAYLVGGGVRDLLLGRRPKDFDIATNASFGEVRRLFPRTRLIGRRFPILHLRLGRSLFEVARFRKRESPEEGMRDPLATDNCYGTPEEDAQARDFTVNALFYDPREGRVIDLVGGLRDLKTRTLRSIGDPLVWYYEDPVRILRAARFVGKLNFNLPAEEREAMEARSSLLDLCPPQRVTEEVFKTLESGGSAQAFFVLWQTGVLAHLLPQLCDVVGATGGDCSDTLRVLQALDTQVLAHRDLPRDYLFAALYYAAVRHRRGQRASAEGNGAPCRPSASDGASRTEWFHDENSRLQIPRAYRARQRALMGIVNDVLGETREKRLARLARHPAFPYLMALLRLHERCFGGVEDCYCRLRKIADERDLNVAPSRRDLCRARVRRNKRRGLERPRRIRRSKGNAPGGESPASSVP